MLKDLDWDALYNYVKLDILNYQDKKMPKEMVLRLIGLKDGKFYANNNVKKEATYDYKLILLTFKLMKGTILMKIVESEINNVKDRIEAKKKSEEKLQEIDLSHQVHEQSNYSKKSGEVNEKLKNLW
jgi:hypothetical protein